MKRRRMGTIRRLRAHEGIRGQTARRIVRLVMLLFLVCVFAGGGRAVGAGAVAAEALSVGLVSEKPKEKIEDYLDFATYLARKLFPGGEIEGKVVIAGTALSMVRLLTEKRVNIYMASPYPTWLINERSGARVLLRRWKRGVGEYSSLIFAKRGSGISRLEDLRGKMIAFKAERSTSGYFLPKVLLISKGFKLTEKFSSETRVAPQEIGYIFAHGAEESIVNWVVLEKVAGGAFSSNDFDKLDEKRKGEIVILAESEAVPRHLLSVSREFNPDLVRRLREVLLQMHLDLEGQRILQKTDETSKFDALPGGEEAMYRKIRQLFGILQGK